MAMASLGSGDGDGDGVVEKKRREVDFRFENKSGEERQG